MAIIVLTSAGGSPGVTTSGLGMALTWPRDVLFADCDRHPSQAVLAGYLRGLPAGGRGLGGLAQAYRAQEPDADVRLLDHTLALADNPARARRFLPGFTHPGSALLFERYWPRLVDQFDDLNAQQTDVIVDWGRLDADGLPQALIERARMVLVFTGSGLPACARLRLCLPGLADSLEGSAAEFGLVVAGGGRPYAASEIAGQLELPLIADLPWDPASAVVLSDGEPAPRKFTERPLWRGFHTLSAEISGRVSPVGRRRLVGVPA